MDWACINDIIVSILQNTFILYRGCMWALAMALGIKKEKMS
jgi:hypothetical protein